MLRKDNFTEVYEPKSSIEYFSELFTDDVIEDIVFQTNLYATQNDVNTTFNVSMSEMKKFIGILIYMGIVNLPAINDYWKNDTRVPQIANVMSRDRFKKSEALYISMTMNVPKDPRIGSSKFDL